MPRIYKGTETMLRLLIDVNTTEPIDKLKIALFTTDRTKAVECYSDSINLHGNIAYVTVYEWTFLDMEDGLINYVATGEIDNKPFITERQSNYILKSTDEYDQSEIMNGYYTKAEVDVRLDAEQDTLVSGKNIKTINGQSVLGAGNIKIEEPDLTGYATEEWVKDQDYATNSDVDEFVGDRVGQVQSQIYAKQDKLVSGQNIKTINGKSILGNGDIVIEGGADSYVLLYPQHYSIEITNQVDWTSEFEEYPYEGSERQAHNKEVIQKLIAGEVKSLYLQVMREEWYEYLDEYTYRVVPVWMYVPVAFRNDNTVDPYYRVTGVISKGEDNTDEVYVIGWRTDANANNCGYFEQQISGGGGGGYDSDPTFESITVNGGAYFNSEIVMAGGGQDGDSDIASGIACAFKAGKTQSIDQWTRNIHTGTDGQGLRVCSSDEYGETQYMAVDTDCNIYEGTTKLSDKYATKAELGDINNILSSI